MTRIPFLAKATMALAALVLLIPATAASLPVAPDQATLYARPVVIQSMVDDPWLGGVWVGTDAGLVFKNLETMALRHYGYAEGLQHNRVQAIHVTADKVWVGLGMGVSVLDKGTQTFNVVRTASGPFQETAAAILVDDRGLWIGTPTGKLFKSDPATLVAHEVPDPMTGTSFPGPIASLGSTGAELVISVTGHGLLVWNRDSQATFLHDKSYVLDKPRVSRILVQPNEIWSGSEGDGLIRLTRSLTGWAASEYSTPDTTGSMNVFRPIAVGTAIYMPTQAGAARFDLSTRSWRDWTTPEMGGSANELVLHDGEVYAGMRFGEIRKYDRQTDSWMPVQWWRLDRTLAQNTIESCAPDGGLIAFTTIGGGVNYLDPQAGTWTLAGKFPWEHGQPHNVAFYAVASTAERRYYGSDSGVSEVDRTTGEYLHYRTDEFSLTEGRKANMVRAIEPDGDDVWFGMLSRKHASTRLGPSEDPYHPGGLSRMDAETHAVRRFSAEAGLTNQNVSSIKATPGEVFVGTQGGLFSFDRATERFTPVGALGAVGDLLLDGNDLWILDGTKGLWHLDTQTRQLTLVPAWPGGIGTSLAKQGQALWVGTLLSGLYNLQLGSNQWSTYHSGQPVDAVALCLVLQGTTLYLGTGWGVERFDTVGRRFLPQLGTPAAAGGTTPTAENAASITLDAIASPVGEATLEVGGQAVLGAGTRIQVRTSFSAWQDAGQASPWSATLEIPPGTRGNGLVLARVVDGQGVLAQATRPFSWDLGESPMQDTVQTGGSAITHTPLREAWVGQPVRLAVGVDPPVEGLEAIVDVTWPGGQTSVPMSEGGDGSFTVDLPAFQVAGMASYKVRLTWPEGSLSLPEPFSAYGESYTVAVRDNDGESRLQIGARPALKVLAGNSTRSGFYVNNVGLAPASATVHASGAAAGWLTGLAPTVVVAPGESVAVLYDIAVPLGTEAGRYAFVITLQGAGEPITKTFELQVGDGASRGSPGIAAPVLMAAALVAVALVRRRMR